MESEAAPSKIIELSLATLDTKPLSRPSPNTLGDYCPEYSPIGEEIAFMRSLSKIEGKIDLWVMQADGTEERRITHREYSFLGPPKWSSDGKFIFTGVEVFDLSLGPLNPDNDGDGVLDGDEINNGTDPNDPNSF